MMLFDGAAADCVSSANVVDAVPRDEDHAAGDDDGLDGSALELLAGGIALEVAVFGPLRLGGFEVSDRCRVIG